MPTTTYRRERTRLADRLRALRQEHGFASGNQFAKQQLGWPQSKLSKLETAKQLPTEDDLQQWVAALGGPPGLLDELLVLLANARVEYATWKEQYRAAGGAAAHEADIGVLESRVTTIREFAPALIPGIVQTAEYARESLRLAIGPSAFGATEADIDGKVSARMQRQQQALYTPGRRNQVVLLEAALRCRVCSLEALTGQLDRLIAIAGLPTVELGIIPLDADMPVFPLGSFSVLDQDLVIIDTLAGEHQLSGDDVELYDRAFELLRGASQRGKDALVVVQRTLAELRAS